MKNVEIKSEKVQKYIRTHKSSFSAEIFIERAEAYVDALKNGTLLFVKKRELLNSTVYRIGYTNNNRFCEFATLFAALGYKTKELEVFATFTGGNLVEDINSYVCEKLFEEGILNEEEFNQLRTIDVATV